MVTIDQIMRGAARFADNEVIPHLPTGKGIGAGIALALIMDESGSVDLDRLYNAARPKLDGQKLPVNIPIIGELRFDVGDLDKLYRYIQEA